MKRTLTAFAASLSLAAATLTVASTAARADTVPCDQQCQAQWQAQRANALPRTAFYDAPNPLRWGVAGALIRHENVSDYRVGDRPITATRILYHSRTSAGRDVAASAVVLVPSGRAPAGGRPVVADAHGTSGSGTDCAPSLMRNLYHGDEMLQFVNRGWAVVAPDYAGLGTDGRDEFINKTAEANNVIDAVRAARRLDVDLSRRWVLWGHSQGGGAALGVAERQAVAPEPGYLGAVVTSPAADLAGAVAALSQQAGLGGFIPLIASGAKVTYPALRLDRVLAGDALDRLPVVRDGCLGVVSAVYANLSGDSLLQPGYLSERHFARFLRDNSTGRRRTGGPILLLQGEADSVITPAMTGRVADSLCGKGSTVDYRTYPGLGHDTYPGVITGIDDGSMPDILAWTADRFAGRPADSTC